MKKIALFFVLATVITLTNAHAQGAKKAAGRTDATAMGQLFNDLQKEIGGRFNLQSVKAGIFANKLNLDVFDPNTNAMQKEERDKKSKAIGDYARSILEKTPAGKNVLKNTSDFGISYMKIPSGGGLTLPSNIFEQYTCRMSELKVN
jgi:hypothetical protein